MNEHKMCINREEIKEILDNKLEIVNHKLDNIEYQTTKTNSRVNMLEDKVHNIEVNSAARLESCPYGKRIDEIAVAVITQKQLRNLLIKGITIAGVFFTILFSLVGIIFRLFTSNPFM